MDGFPGEKGLAGDPGDIIFVGTSIEPPQGPKGDMGDRGMVGEFGFYGEPGEPGAYGDNGAFGRKVLLTTSLLFLNVIVPTCGLSLLKLLRELKELLESLERWACLV